MILDTSFLLDLKDGDPDAFERATEMYNDEIVQRIAAPSVMELYYGARYVDSREEYRRVGNLLTMYPIETVDDETARRAGETLARADRRADGHSGVDNEDALIAAVADRLDEPVLTRNVADFDALGVDVETY